MRTTLNIDEELIDYALKATGEKTKSKAVNAVLKEYVRRRKIAALRALAGKIQMVDNLQELEALEMEELRNLGW